MYGSVSTIREIVVKFHADVCVLVLLDPFGLPAFLKFFLTAIKNLVWFSDDKTRRLVTLVVVA